MTRTRHNREVTVSRPLLGPLAHDSKRELGLAGDGASIVYYNGFRTRP
jgi:hypothetical protein